MLALAPPKEMTLELIHVDPRPSGSQNPRQKTAGYRPLQTSAATIAKVKIIARYGLENLNASQALDLVGESRSLMFVARRSAFITEAAGREMKSPGPGKRGVRSRLT